MLTAFSVHIRDYFVHIFHVCKAAFFHPISLHNKAADQGAFPPKICGKLLKCDTVQLSNKLLLSLNARFGSIICQLMCAELYVAFKQL